MKTIKDLKQGDTIYTHNSVSPTYYTYVCVHPHNSRYHILLKSDENPIKIYEKDLKVILDEGLSSMKDAEIALANHLEQKVSRLRKEVKNE